MEKEIVMRLYTGANSNTLYYIIVNDSRDRLWAWNATEGYVDEMTGTSTAFGLLSVLEQVEPSTVCIRRDFQDELREAYAIESEDGTRYTFDIDNPDIEIID